MDKFVLKATSQPSNQPDKKNPQQTPKTEEREAGVTLNFTRIQASAWKNKTVKSKSFALGSEHAAVQRITGKQCL